MLFIRKQFFMYFIYHLLALLIKLKLRQFDSILDDTLRDGLFRPAPYPWTRPRPDCQVLDTPYLTSTNWQGAKLTYSKTYLKLTLSGMASKSFSVNCFVWFKMYKNQLSATFPRNTWNHLLSFSQHSYNKEYGLNLFEVWGGLVVQCTWV